MRHNKTERCVAFLGWVCLAALATTAAFPQREGGTPASVTAARADISTGKLESAEAKLWALLSSNPNQPDALALLGEIRNRQERYAEGEALLRRALQLDPKATSARRSLAFALLAQDKTDAAVRAYTDFLAIAPQDIPARIQLANLLLSKGQFPEALADINAISPSRFPEEAIPAKAASLIGLGRKREALALIPMVKSPRVTAEMAEVLLNGSSPADALKLLDAFLKKSQRPPGVFYALKARSQQALGDRAGAQASFGRALALDPKSTDILIATAALSSSEGKHAESLTFLKRANALHPNSPQILRPIVIEGMKAGDLNTALRAAQMLADKNPDSLDDLYLAAAVMLEGKDFAAASAILQKYVLQRPEDSRGFLGLGIAELAQQHFDSAAAALQRALQIDPNSADAEYQLAVLANQQGQSPEELKHLQRAIQLQPLNAKALASLGGQYLQAGDLEKAQAVLERSVAVDPNNYKAEYDLALVLAKLGKPEEAKPHMDRSRALKEAQDSGKSPSAAAKNQ